MHWLDRSPSLTALLCSVLAATEVHAQASAPSTSAPAAEAPAAPVQASPGSEQGGAPSAEAVQEAGRRYDLGLKLYAEGEYALAVIEFERTYQLVADYRVLYNIGQVRIQLGNHARARRALEQYLKDGGDRIPAGRRTAVSADLDMLAARTATLAVEVSVAGADVLVDELVVGQSPLPEPLLLDAGEHRVSARKSGYEERNLPAILAGRDALSVRLELVRIADRPQSIIVERPVVAAPSDRSTWQWATWSATGVLAIGSGVTGFLGIKAAGDLSDLREKQGASRSELDSASRRARTLLLTADVLGALAIASGGVALYLTLSSPEPSAAHDAPSKKKPAPVHAALVLGPGQLSVVGTY